MPAAPKVFISYSHDGDAHKARVLALADRLRHAGGIEAIIDQYVQFPPEGWPLWCEKQIDRADFVLMVCTEVYLRRVRNEEIPATGLGVLWEAQLIRQELYDSGSVSTKFVPVRFADGSDAHIPRPVRRFSRYVVDTADGYEALYRYLTNQPATPPPQIGEREMLAPAARPGRGELEEAIRIRKEDVLPVFVHLGDKRELLMGRWWLASHLLRRRSPGDDREAEQLLCLALADAQRMRLPEATQIEAFLQEYGLRCD